MPALKPYVFENGSIYLPLPPAMFETLPKFIQHGSDDLQKKTEFHVTLISVEEIILTVGSTADIRHKEIEASAIEIFNRFVAHTPLRLARLIEDDVRFAVQNEKKSILVLCAVPHIDELFAEVNKSYGIHLRLQPTHVTLYTLQKDVDISITNELEMNQLEHVAIYSLTQAISAIEIPAGA